MSVLRFGGQATQDCADELSSIRGPVMAKATTPDRDEEMETVTSADGTEIAFERRGSGPPLVLVHGSTANHTSWRLALPGLEEHITGYALDRRGRGESGDADEYALEREVEDVVAVIDSIDEPVTLLGHSYGAFLSLEAALRTDNLSKLILYEPAISVDDHEFTSEAVLVEMKTLLDAGENEQAVVLFLEEAAKFSPAEIDALRAAPNWQEKVDSAHTLANEGRAEAEYEFDAARFAEIATPTVLLAGSESPPRYKAATEAVNDTLPNGRIVTFDGHRHAAMLTAPDRFVAEVLAFTLDSN